MNLHTGDITQLYACITRGKNFSGKGHLNEHVRTHTGEKPYACITCDKKFSQKSSLTRHRRTHTKPKRKGKRMDAKKNADPVPIAKFEGQYQHNRALRSGSHCGSPAAARRTDREPETELLQAQDKLNIYKASLDRKDKVSGFSYDVCLS